MWHVSQAVERVIISSPPSHPSLSTHSSPSPTPHRARGESKHHAELLYCYLPGGERVHVHTAHYFVRVPEKYCICCHFIVAQKRSSNPRRRIRGHARAKPARLTAVLCGAVPVCASSKPSEELWARAPHGLGRCQRSFCLCFHCGFKKGD